MTPDDLLSYFKTKAAIASAIGIDRQVVHGWFARRRVPLGQQTRFEVVTSGHLKADVGTDFRRVVMQCGGESNTAGKGHPEAETAQASGMEPDSPPLPNPEAAGQEAA